MDPQAILRDKSLRSPSAAPEKVTAVMLTPGRPVAKMAIKSFLSQTYAAKELLILNHGDVPLLQESHPLITEHVIPMKASGEGAALKFTCSSKGIKGLRLGDLRNSLYDRCKPGWVIQWDDDDFSSADRITYQMAHRIQGHCVVLANQIRYSFVSGSAFAHREPGDGIAGTILFRSPLEYLYLPISRHEDSTFYLRNFGHKRVILDNPPSLYVRLHHGSNISGEQHIMKSMAGQKSKWILQPEDRNSLMAILHLYKQAGLCPKESLGEVETTR